MKKIILLLLSTILQFSLFAQIQIEKKNLSKEIKYLSGDKLGGRSPGSKGERKAAKYITSKFSKYGLQARGTDGYYQPFTYKENVTNPHATDEKGAKKRTGKNIIAYLDNSAEYTIVIGAHYDHLGHGDHGNSLDPDPKGKIHNGADDNASGTAGVIELARYYAENKVKENYNFLFICFSAEEAGLIGSKYFTANPTIDLGKVNCMFNMDMIGRLNDSTKTLLVYGTGTSPEFETWVHDMQNDNIRVITDSSGVGPSDHTSFYLKNIPVLHFFSGQHSDYHKPSDDFEKINLDGEVQILKYIIRLVDRINEKPKLPFTPTRNPESARTSFKVTLGVMPDYSYTGKGLRIDGVTDGKPASKAGLKQGDIIIQLGKTDIDNIKDYTKALGKFEKGEKTVVKWIRGETAMEAEVTF